MDATAILLGAATGALICALGLIRRRGSVSMAHEPGPQILDLSEPDRAAIERLSAGMRELSGQIAHRRADPPKQREQPQAIKAKQRKR